MPLVRFRPRRKGIKALLSTPEVAAELAERAERAAVAARADYTGDPPNEGEVDVRVEVQTKGKRGKGRKSVNRKVRARAAVVAVHPAVLAIEGDRRVLGAALDAAK
jgi:hypothetical protein